MKHYKRTRIIASLALLGSLTFGGPALAATDAQTTTYTTSSVSRPLGNRGVRERLATTTEETRTHARNKSGKGAKNGNRKNGTATSTPRFMGTVTSVNGSSFTIERSAFGYKNATNTPAITEIYTVNTTSGTVYMKDGQLDSLADVVNGVHVKVTGILDSTTGISTAQGVNVVTKVGKRKVASRI